MARKRLRMLKPLISTMDHRTVRPRDVPPAAFYQSREWRQLVDRLMVERFGSRANARCEDPGCETPSRVGIRVYGDHIWELKDGGPPLDPSNIVFRCGSCHGHKTHFERSIRGDRVGG